jgi:hypothetical protein
MMKHMAILLGVLSLLFLMNVSCSVVPQDLQQTGLHDAQISFRNDFATDVTNLEYNNEWYSGTLVAGTGGTIAIPAYKTGWHKIKLFTNGTNLISTDEYYTAPGGSTAIYLSPSQFTNY